MSTFRSVARGKRAFKVYEVPGLDPDSETPEKIGLRLLSAIELADVVSKARKFAESRGSKDPRPGDELYDMGRMCSTLALAVVDSDSQQDDPRPFFPGGDAQVLEFLDEDVVSYIYAIWEQHCESQSPRQLRVDGAEFLDGLSVMLGEDEGKAAVFFSRWRPGMQLQFVRTLASLWRSSLPTSSDSTTPSAPPEKSSSSAPLPSAISAPSSPTIDPDLSGS